jgi:ABC-2 type transport system ATP-binding protein
MIKVQNLLKQFDQLVAVNDISFEIPDGEVFGLLGPNGAGKTTTINMIVGALKPDGGSVEVDGFGDPTKPEIRLRLGYAPQTIAIYDRLTATENLEFFGRMYGLSGRQLKDRVDWAVDFAALEDRKKDLAGKYSGGMKRRLNLAGALVHDPPVLLLDEPTVGVDPQSRNMIFESIEGLKHEGRTIIYTTHYMEEAQRLCDRVAIIDNGKILAMDRVDKLIEQHGGDATIEAELTEESQKIPQVRGKIVGNRLIIKTSKPMEELARLSKAGMDLVELKVERPNLETVFLNLTGRSLRD